MNTDLFQYLLKDVALKNAVENAKSQDSFTLYGMEPSFRGVFLSLLFASLNRNIFYVTDTDFAAKKLTETFQKIFPDILFYPAAGLYSALSTAHDRLLDFERLLVLRAVTSDKPHLIITSAEALGCKITPQLNDHVLSLSLQDEMDILDLSAELIQLGYERCELTESVGQFSIRGNLADVFVVGEEMPVRIDFFGDTVESIKVFHPQSQSSLHEIEKIDIYPACENIYTPQQRKYFLSQSKKEINERIASIHNNSALSDTEEQIEEHLLQLDGRLLERAVYLPPEQLSPSNLLTYDEKALVVIDNVRTVASTYETYYENHLLLYTELFETGKVLKAELGALFEPTELFASIQQKQVLFLEHLAPSSQTAHGVLIPLHIRSTFAEYKNYSMIQQTLQSYFDQNYQVLFSYHSPKEFTNLKDLLQAAHVDLSAVTFIQSRLNKGFDLYQAKIVCLCAGEMLKTSPAPTAKKKTTDTSRFFSDIALGDFVVHDTFGIGIYRGTNQVLTDQVRRDYVIIEYALSSLVYVPLDQMHKVQKYIGSSEAAPRLSHLGSADWSESKAKTRRAIEEMATDLIALYSARQKAEGFAFEPDSVWQSEFEDAFAFEETNEQRKCTEEIKRDMESIKPMDRLLCGDVGYGKTEVAQRAVFKAVDNGKQVAVLVPTTVLALQHFTNFTERFSSFPVTIEMLSRFKTKTQQKNILKRLQEGKVDIVIGTHRLLSDDVLFKDLGLLVIDEEQRFGVAHKEKIKTYKKSIDVLTLTATPIPRTLHMSMIGIRDISVINEPPPNRFPVLPFVMEYDQRIIRNAIYRELSQGGQIYYIYNKVRGIEAKAKELQELIPEARIAYGHGQMRESTLEKLMTDFIAHQYDIFLSTTIVENGLDIANANTMIIEDAHRIGLAQLYQLKGRIGRGPRQAYAYITYPAQKLLSEDSLKRLKTIRDFTSFGSGYKIALRDLQIRGAGNILGLSQSGHFGEVGYEMYARILSEVLSSSAGQEPEKTINTEIDLLINAFIPQQYIADETQRIDLYHQIARLHSLSEADLLKKSLTDRYGALPKAVENLLQIGYIKNFAHALDIEKIVQEKTVIKMLPAASFDTLLLEPLYKRYPYRIVKNKGLHYLHFENKLFSSPLQYVQTLLNEIYSLKNSSDRV